MKRAKSWNVKIFVMLIVLLSSFVLAANNPGHDTLYIEQANDSVLTGNLNITYLLTAEGNVWIKSYLDLIANGTVISSSPSRNTIYGTNSILEIDTASGGGLYLNKYGGVVYTGSPSARTDLNISGNLYIYNPTGASTLTVGNIAVCLANGTNCPAQTPISGANSAGGWTNTTTTTTTNLNVVVDTDTLFVDSTNNKVGIGTTDTSLGRLVINSTGTNTGLYIQDTGTSTYGLMRLAGGGRELLQIGGTTGSLSSVQLGINVTTLPDLVITGVGVGIKTLTPTNTLQVNGTTNTTYLTIATATAASCDLKAYTNGTVYCGTDSTGSGGDGTGGWTNNTQNTTTLLNVGIGTTTPENKLDVNGSLTIRGGVLNSYDTATPTNYLHRFTHGGTGGGSLQLYDDGSIEILLSTETPTYFNTGTNFGIGTTSPTTLLDVRGNTSLNQTLYVTTNGYVGIGNASPQAALDVNGNIITRGGVFNSYDPNSPGNYLHRFTHGGTGDGTLQLYDDGSIEINIAANSNTYFNSGYNVGINTSSPNYTLHVNGPIRVTTGNDICIQGGACLSTVGASGGGWTDDGTVVRLTTSTDKVGIATSSPEAYLQIGPGAPGTVTGMTTGRNATHLEIDAANTAPVEGRSVVRTTANYGGAITQDSKVVALYGRFGGSSTANLTTLYVEASNAGTGGTYAANFIGGNVGIGTTVPRSKLSILDSSALTTYSLGLRNDYGTSADLAGAGLTFGRGEGTDSQVWASIVGSQEVASDFTYGKLQFATRTSGGVSTKLTILSTGNTGIGTVTPTSTLQVNGTTNTTYLTIATATAASCDLKAYTNGTVYCGTDTDTNSGGTVTGTGTGGYITQFQSASVINSSAIYQNGSNIGIGTTTPSSLLHISGTDTSTNLNVVGLVTGSAHSTSSKFALANGVALWFYDSNGQISRTGNNLDVLAGGNLTLTAGGAERVRVGTSLSSAVQVLGDVNVSRNILYGGNLTSYGADFAERFTMAEYVEPGDVVCMDNNSHIRKCTAHGQASVAGVVSEQPTIIGNALAKNSVPVGVVGIVNTKIKGPVDRFDLITTSNKKGYGEKATINDFGAIIGKAMEPCNKSVCEIKVLVGLR